MIKKLWEKATLSWEMTAVLPFCNLLLAVAVIFLADICGESDMVFIIGEIFVYLIQVLIIILAYHTILKSKSRYQYTAIIISTILANIILFILTWAGLFVVHLATYKSMLG